MGDGIAGLLSGVEEHGSLKAAAESMGMSYRHAWGLLREIEKRLGEPLLRRQVGGDTGGGSELTPRAKRLLERFTYMRAELEAEAERLYRALDPEFDG